MTVRNCQMARDDGVPCTWAEPPVFELLPYSKTLQPESCVPVEPLGGPATPVAFEKSPPVTPVETSEKADTRLKPGLLPAKSCPPLMRIGARGVSISPPPLTMPP